MTEIKKNEFNCHFCDYKTSNCSFWLKHLKTQKHLREGKTKTSKCETCGYESHIHWNLKLHTLSQHSTIEERKNQHINELMKNHEEAFREMKEYYNDITRENLELIRMH
jgi:hypothetical protein